MKRSIPQRALRYATTRAIRQTGAPRSVAWRAANKITRPKRPPTDRN